MPNVTLEQWQEHQSHPVTAALKAAILERIEASKNELADPDSDNNRDRFLKGMIWAFNEVLEARPDITVEGPIDGEPEGEQPSREDSY